VSTHRPARCEVSRQRIGTGTITLGTFWSAPSTIRLIQRSVGGVLGTDNPPKYCRPLRRMIWSTFKLCVGGRGQRQITNTINIVYRHTCNWIIQNVSSELLVVDRLLGKGSSHRWDDCWDDCGRRELIDCNCNRRYMDGIWGSIRDSTRSSSWEMTRWGKMRRIRLGWVFDKAQKSPTLIGP